MLANQTPASHISVALRIRPLNQTEAFVTPVCFVHALDDHQVLLADTGSTDTKRSKEKTFAFDLVFPPDSSQQQVFQMAGLPLLQGVMNGFNSTVFAYGATGAGKTFTMLGTAQSPGLILNCFEELFRLIETQSVEREYNVKVSYLEIYNENVRDLLKPSQAPLDIREDKQRGLIIAGLREVIPTSAAHLKELIREGTRRRVTEGTGANAISSRSHSLLQVTIGHRDKLLGTDAQIYFGKFSLCDLAGSERVGKTLNRGARLVEGGNINKSLLALGNCITALFDAQNRGVKGFIPYRDSKLTRILKDSLEGNCRTLMIGCVSPALNSYEDSTSTLEYASRAKQIKTTVKRNELNVQVHISKYTVIIQELKAEVSKLQSELSLKTPGSHQHKLALNLHFEEEAKIHQNICQAKLQTTKLEFELFAKQALKQAFAKEDPSLEATVGDIEAEIQKREQQASVFEATLRELEAKREGLKDTWADLSEQAKTQLSLEFDNHVLKLKNIERDAAKQQKEAALQHKDVLIQLLTDQLKLRDSIIESTTKLLSQEDVMNSPKLSKHMNGLKSADALIKNSTELHPRSHFHKSSKTVFSKKSPFQAVASKIVAEQPPPKRTGEPTHPTPKAKVAPIHYREVKLADRVSKSPYILRTKSPKLDFKFRF